MENLKVQLIAAELTPLAKVGGLADVVGALPKALKKIGVDVRIVIPKYGIVDKNEFPMEKIVDEIKVPFDDGAQPIAVWQTLLPGSNVPVYLIEHEEYLGGGGVYFEQDASSGGSDREAKRFTFLARASLELFEPLNWYPDIVHCQDWHAGMVPVILNMLQQQNDKLAHIKTLLTIHNLEYQGWYDADTIFKLLGITADDYPTLQTQRNGQISSLQQAILSADALNTVSPNYAKEILTPAYGAGLESSLAKRREDLTGIVNGIDVERFDPSADEHIAARYSLDQLDGKKTCKQTLQEKCNLPTIDSVPVLGIVSRLADQKGIELIAQIGDSLAKEEMQFILLGTGDPDLEKQMASLAKKYPDKMHAAIEFNAAFAQQIYAGSDMFLMPSRFEPCGLGQMIAMRYGTVPIVRATGGLADTVRDIDLKTGDGDGFVFEQYESTAFLSAIQRGLQLYQEQDTWYTVVKRIMQKDFSWTASAEKYKNLYNQLVA